MPSPLDPAPRLRPSGRAMDFTPPRPRQLRRRRRRRSPGDAGSWRIAAAVRARRLGAAQPDRRAVQHPLGLDAADDDDRRLSVRPEMALRLFALQLPVPVPAVRRPHLRLDCPSAATSSCSARRGRSRSISSSASSAFPATRSRSTAGTRHPQRQARSTRQSAGMIAIPRQPQQPVPRRPGRHADGPRQRATAGSDCLYPAYRETLPGGRSLSRPSTRSTPRPATISRRSQCPPATCS